MSYSGADEPSGPALSVAFSAIGRSVKFAAAASTPAALTNARTQKSRGLWKPIARR